MKNILIISGHTNLKKSSFTNKTILDYLKLSFPQAEFSYLDELYPTFAIDARKEQQKLLKADIIVFQFPIFWYSVPSLLACWFEQVFTFGFAYGEHGSKLSTKKVILSYSTGSAESAYSPTDYQKHSIRDYLLPLIQTIELCEMEIIDHIYSGGMNIVPNDEKHNTTIHQKAIHHAEKLTNLIKNV